MTQERRRYRRVKLAPKLDVKAKVTFPSGRVHYFKIDNLSLGGMSLLQQSDKQEVDYKAGDHLQIMIYSNTENVKLIAEVLEVPASEGQETASVRAKIVGIDEKARVVLANFLEKMAESQGPIL